MTKLANRLAEALSVTVEESYGLATLDIAPDAWVPALTAARDAGCAYFDFLSAVDEPDGIRLVAHLAAPAAGRPVEHLLVRTLLPAEAPRVRTAAEVYAGARWHERETAEMFGVEFLDAEDTPIELEPLLLPPGHEGHPLRKEHLLAARLESPWPGAKEPGESDATLATARPSRRRLRPPGVPKDWVPPMSRGEA